MQAAYRAAAAFAVCVMLSIAGHYLQLQENIATEPTSPTTESGPPNRQHAPRLAAAPRSVCFAPGTPPEFLEQFDDAVAYSAMLRWSLTANGPTGQSGYPVTLTYSFVSDGVLIHNGGLGGDEYSPNNLSATLTTLFGSAETGKNQFRAALARWGELTGVHYVEEPNDDGAAFPSSPGLLGVRGDVRIAMRALDGAAGVLAFNYYPNLGDMVLDSAESWDYAPGSYRFMRNTIMHEAGHGLGLGHVWPLDQSKLMEAILTTSFDGPQDDDIRGIHNYYGDVYELNASALAATDLGDLAETVVEASQASTLSASDFDWYSFSIGGPKDVTITVTPLGSTYQVGSSSTNTPTINTKAVGNLAFRLRGAEGISVLAEVDNTAAGGAESFTASLIEAGTYYLQVYATSAAGPQRYQVSLASGTLSDSCGVDTDGNGIGDYCESQLTLADCPGDISVSADGDEGATVTWTTPSVSGAYGSWNLIGSHEPGEFFSVGETVVSYTAVDASGKTAECSFRVTVGDTLVAGETVNGPGCGFIGMATYAFMLISYALVLTARRR